MLDQGFRFTNQEARNKWEIDRKVDPYSIPLHESNFIYGVLDLPVRIPT